MRPVFIICAEAGAQDRESNLLSFFNVIERITISAPPPDDQALTNEGVLRPSLPIGLPTMRLFIMAAWTLDESDIGATYETAFRIDSPGLGPQDLPIQRFEIPKDDTFVRFKFVYEGPPFFSSSGLVTISNLVRRVGEEIWQVQSYPIIVQITGDGVIPAGKLRLIPRP